MRTLNELQLAILITLGRTVEESDASEDSPEWGLLQKLEAVTTPIVQNLPCSRYYIEDIECQGRFEVCEADPELHVENNLVCGQLWIAVAADLKDALTNDNVKALVGAVMAEAQKIQADTGGPEPRLAGLRKYEVWTESVFSSLPMPA